MKHLDFFHLLRDSPSIITDDTTGNFDKELILRGQRLRKGQSEIQAFGRKSQQPFWEKAHRRKQGRGDALPSLPGS